MTNKRDERIFTFDEHNDNTITRIQFTRSLLLIVSHCFKDPLSSCFKDSKAFEKHLRFFCKDLIIGRIKTELTIIR